MSTWFDKLEAAGDKPEPVLVEAYKSLFNQEIDDSGLSSLRSLIKTFSKWLILEAFYTESMINGANASQGDRIDHFWNTCLKITAEENKVRIII